MSFLKDGVDRIPEDAFKYIERQERVHDALLESMATITRQTQKAISETYAYEVDLATAGTGGGNLITQGIHLPSKAEISFFYLENNGSAATVNIFAGNAGGSGKLLNLVKFGHWKCYPISDGITSLSLVSTATDTGVIRCVLTTDRGWAAASGSL